MALLAAGIIMTGIAIALLLVYGADVMAAYEMGSGFLPLDHMMRGMLLGGPSIVLPIVAFFISRNVDSKLLGVLIIVTGILIISGGTTILITPEQVQLTETDNGLENTMMADNENNEDMMDSNPMSQFFLLGIGIFIVALGAIKIKKSS